MNKLENKYTFKNINVEHIFEHAKQDRQHLLVIFSGFTVDYEFRGEAAEGCRSNILWIKDNFYGNCTYYLCHKKNFIIEQAVLELIEFYRTKLGLTKNQCTLMGFSKGGSAALYYAFKYDFINVIASCPQINIGTYVSTNWQLTARHMLDEDYSPNDIAELDAILPNLLNSDKIFNKNVYLISSPQDIQYKTEIEPYLDFFSRCNNFNFIFTQSTLAWQHNKVTRYNIPIILSIIHAHSEGIIPSFGQVSNGVSEYDQEHSAQILSQQKEKLQSVVSINKIRVENGVLYPDGCAFIKGIECKEYRHINQLLIMHGNNRYEFPLGKVINEDLSYKYFESVFCDYRTGGFSSLGYKGIDLSQIENGSYLLKIQVQAGGVTVETNAEPQKTFNSQCLFNERVYSIHNHGGKLILNIASSVNSTSARYFEVKQKWIKDTTLHYEGIFAIRGIFNENWGDSTFYLTIKSQTYEKCYMLGMCHHDYLNNIFNDHEGIYQKSYFCTIGSKGINLEEDIPDGGHDIFISMFQRGISYTQQIDDKLIKDNGIISLM